MPRFICRWNWEVLVKARTKEEAFELANDLWNDDQCSTIEVEEIK